MNLIGRILAYIFFYFVRMYTFYKIVVYIIIISCSDEFKFMHCHIF